MLKLTTDRHEASHGLFGTAELLVLAHAVVSYWLLVYTGCVFLIF